MKTLKVLHITVHLGGGAGKAISGLILTGKERVESTVIVLEAPKDMLHINRLIANRIPVYIEPTRKVIQILMGAADLVVINWWGHPLMVHFLKNLPAIPCRAMLWSHVNGCTYPYLDVRFLEHFGSVLFTSPFSLENPGWTFEERESVCSRSCIVYGIGDFCPEKIQPKTYYLSENQFVIGYVGTLNYAKLNPGFLDFYEAAIQENLNTKCYMLGHPEEEIKNDIEARGLREKFVFPGFVESPGEYYRKMDAFVYLLNTESYATTENSLLEAMAYGLPIIVLDHELERKIISDGINGFLVKDKKDFLSVIARLKDREYSKEAGERARRYCIEHYSAMNNFENFYRECLKLMEIEPDRLSFCDILGESAFENFLHFAGSDAEIFKNYVRNPERYFAALKNVKPIYRQKDKGSVYQYLRYNPNDRELNLIVEGWEGNEN